MDMDLSKVISLALIVNGAFGWGVAIAMPGDQIILLVTSGLLLGFGLMRIFQSTDIISKSGR